MSDNDKEIGYSIKGCIEFTKDLLDNENVAEDILIKYEILADEITRGNYEDIIEINSDTYDVILTDAVANWIYFQYKVSNSFVNEYANKNENLKRLINSDDFVNKVTKMNRGNHTKMYSLSEIKTGLMLFGITEELNSELDDNYANKNDSFKIPFDDDIIEEALKSNNNAYSDEEDDEEGDNEKVDIYEDDNTSLINIDNDTNEVIDNIKEVYEYCELNSDEEEEIVPLNQSQVRATLESDRENYEMSKAKEVESFDTHSDADDIYKNPLDDSNAEGEILSFVSNIISKNEAIFRGCMELEKSQGILYRKGRMTTKVVDGKLVYVEGLGGGTSTLENLYKALTIDCGKQLNAAPDLRFVPNVENITGQNTSAIAYNYYPGFIYKYAVGCVDKKIHKTWASFRDELRDDLMVRCRKYISTNTSSGNMFFNYKDQIRASFTNAFLVLRYGADSGIKIRMCVSGYKINDSLLEKRIREIDEYSSAKIITTHVNQDGNPLVDVVDILILIKPKEYFKKPTWAYKAMEVKLNNNEKLNITKGIPFGETVDGRTVEMAFNSDSFVKIISAGSRSGKGVLTLGICAAAVGNGIPIHYIDRKPDMAPIFWKFEKENGVPTFSYDAISKFRVHSPTPDKHRLGYNIPKELSRELGQHGCALFYLKALNLMTTKAKYKGDNELSSPEIWVFDEINKAHSDIIRLCSTVNILMKKYKPKKVKGDYEEYSEEYKYLCSLGEFILNVNEGLNEYVFTTGGKGAVYSLWLGQRPEPAAFSYINVTQDIIRDEKGLKCLLIGHIINSGNVERIIGRGCSNTRYGTGSADKILTQGDKDLIANNRFFVKYNGLTIIDCGGKVEVFKPFLAVNYNDIFDQCWTNGIGNQIYGYVKSGSDEEEAKMSIQEKINKNRQYIDNIKVSLSGGNSELEAHPGTGFLGLAGMYCNQDMNKLKDNMSKAYYAEIKFLKDTHLDTLYDNPSDYLYDNSINGLVGRIDICDESITDYNNYKEEIEVDSEDDEITGSKEISSGINLGENSEKFDTNDSNLGNSNSKYTDKESNKLNNKGLFNRFDNKEIASQINKARNLKSDETTQNSDEGYNFDDDQSELDDEPNTVDCNGTMLTEDEIAYRSKILTQGFNRDETFGYDNSGRANYIKNVPNTSSVTRLTQNNSILASFENSSILGKSHKNLYKTFGGAKYEFNLRWKAILDSVDKVFNPMLVTRMTIIGDAIFVNNRQIVSFDIIGGEANLRIVDIVNFKMTADKYKNLTLLALDEEILEKAQTFISGDYLDYLFNTFTCLTELILIDGDGTTARVTRNDYLSRESSDSYDIDNMDRAAKRGSLKSKFEAVTASKNTRLQDKGVAYKSKVFDSALSFSSDAGKVIKSNLLSNDVSFLRTTTLGVASVVALTGGALLGSLGWAFSKITGR